MVVVVVAVAVAVAAAVVVVVVVVIVILIIKIVQIFWTVKIKKHIGVHRCCWKPTEINF